MRSKFVSFLTGACLLAGITAATAAGVFTNGVPPAGGSQYPTTIPLTGNETLPADTNLTSGLNPASEAITVAQISGAARAAYGSGGWRNGLIGGDFGTNLWQRGTTGAATTTAVLYGADRWWALSGTGTEVKIIKETSAADITTGFAASGRLQRTASQTGVVASCIGQVLTSANSTRFQSKLVEFSVHLLAGANFSAASSNVTMTIATGTGADESAANFSTGAWTGYAATTQTTTISTTWTRYSMVASIPAAATQIGVKICFTPVGTAGANDWFEMAGAQLDDNAAAVAYNGVTSYLGNMASYERRPASEEAQLQYAYYYQLNDPAATVQIGSCQVITANTAAVCLVPLPVVMRAAPTITAPGSNTAFAITAADGSANVCTALAVTGSAVVTQPGGQVQVTCTPTSNIAITVPSHLIGDAQAFSIKASAEL